MWNELFVFALGAVFFSYLAWGFRRLPEEKWQIFASLPQRQDAAGYWQGLNLTYYGLFSSAAQLVSVAMIFLLFGAVGITRSETVLLSVIMLGACIPGSKIVALLVEKKAAVFSVGAAAFIGIVLAPWVVLFSNATLGRLLGSEIPVLPALSAISIGYAFGEGLGRTILQHLENFPKGKPVLIDIPECFKSYIDYTKRDHDRNSASRTVHRQFRKSDTAEL